MERRPGTSTFPTRRKAAPTNHSASLNARRRNSDPSRCRDRDPRDSSPNPNASYPPGARHPGTRRAPGHQIGLLELWHPGTPPPRLPRAPKSVLLPLQVLRGHHPNVPVL